MYRFHLGVQFIKLDTPMSKKLFVTRKKFRKFTDILGDKCFSCVSSFHSKSFVFFSWCLIYDNETAKINIPAINSLKVQSILWTETQLYFSLLQCCNADIVQSTQPFILKLLRVSGHLV